MKKLMMLSAVAALMLGGSAFAADDTTVQIKAAAQAGYKLQAGEFKDYDANYALGNGSYIRFSQSGRHYWARLHGSDKVELFAVQPRVFMTASGTRVEFQESGDRVVIDNYERLPMAVAMDAVNVRVVAAR